MLSDAVHSSVTESASDAVTFSPVGGSIGSVSTQKSAPAVMSPAGCPTRSSALHSKWAGPLGFVLSTLSTPLKASGSVGSGTSEIGKLIPVYCATHPSSGTPTTSSLVTTVTRWSPTSTGEPESIEISAVGGVASETAYASLDAGPMWLSA